MPILKRGDPGFSNEEEATDLAYLKSINTELVAVMQHTKLKSPGMDYIILAHHRTDGTSTLTTCSRKKWIAGMRESLRLDPGNALAKNMVDGISNSPSSPLARWVLICRDSSKSMSLISVATVDVARSNGSA